MDNSKSTKYYKYHTKEIDNFIARCTKKTDGDYDYKCSKKYINTAEWSDSSKFTPVVSTIVKNNPYNYNKLINEKLLPAELEKLKINAEYVILAKRRGYFKNSYYSYARIQCILWVSLEYHQFMINEYNKKWNIFNDLNKFKTVDMPTKLKELQKKFKKN
tara:strand:+ start:52 stop:531 length:480 start_codon:yes stop_codon:yes gene_type:complete